MEVIKTSLPHVLVLRASKFGDERGFFSETYSRRTFAKAGVLIDFVQDNYSLSSKKGTVRGLHFQIPPYAQDKLVRVLRGAILDVVVDLRHGSPTFGKHESLVLSAADWTQLFVPAGFAHGFCTLENDAEVVYKVSNYYSAAHDKGVRWDDPALSIDWPVAKQEAILSPKDQALPLFSELGHYFDYEGEGKGRKALSA